MRTAAGRFLQVAGTFNPLTLAPKLWFDAADTASITSSGGLVTQINDKSGNGKHGTASAGDRPTTGASTINGRNVLDFTANKLTISAPTNAATASFYVVLKTSDVKFVLLFDAVGGGHFDWAADSTNAVSPPTAGSGSPTFRKNGSSVTYSTRAAIATGLSTGATVQATSESVNLSGWSASNLFLGGYTTSGFDLTCQLCELLIFASNLASSDRTAVENYLLGKWT